MPTVALEGTGARIHFHTTNFTSDLVSLQLPERAREAIETTHLGSKDTKTWKPGVLLDPGQVTAEFDHDPRAPRLIYEQIEWISIYYPKQPGERIAARMTFEGFVVSEGGEEFSVGSRLTSKATIQVTSAYRYSPAQMEEEEERT